MTSKAFDGLGNERDSIPVTISSTINGVWHFSRLTTNRGWIAKCECGFTKKEHYKADATYALRQHRLAVMAEAGITN
jgi:hypothetical protein